MILDTGTDAPRLGFSSRHSGGTRQASTCPGLLHRWQRHPETTSEPIFIWENVAFLLIFEEAWVHSTPRAGVWDLLGLNYPQTLRWDVLSSKDRLTSKLIASYLRIKITRVLICLQHIFISLLVIAGEETAYDNNRCYHLICKLMHTVTVLLYLWSAGLIIPSYTQKARCIHGLVFTQSVTWWD